MVAQTCFTDLILYDHQNVSDPTPKLLALFQLLKGFPPKKTCPTSSVLQVLVSAMVCPVTSGPGGSPNCAFFSSPMEARTSANLRSRSQGVILDLVATRKALPRIIPGSPMGFSWSSMCVCVCFLVFFWGGMGWCVFARCWDRFIKNKYWFLLYHWLLVALYTCLLISIS